MTRVVAFGGGHGLGALLRALTRLEVDITAVVTVGDNGGSSGRLRVRGLVPPGDLRQALVALAAEHAGTTAELFQHRFGPSGGGGGRARQAAADGLAGHPVGNLVLCGLMELLGDPVVALDHAARMVSARGRVLPMSREPVSIEAEITGADPGRPGQTLTVRGQHEVAVSPGRVELVRMDPPKPLACREAVAAVAAADWLVFGPGSWYTSVIPHLLVPDLLAAIGASRARRLVILNLTTEPETAGLTLPEHLTALAAYAPGLTVDVVLGDAAWRASPEPIRRAAGSLGAELVLAPVAGAEARHDPVALADALVPVLTTASPDRAAGPSPAPPSGALRPGPGVVDQVR